MTTHFLFGKILVFVVIFGTKKEEKKSGHLSETKKF